MKVLLLSITHPILSVFELVTNALVQRVFKLQALASQCSYTVQQQHSCHCTITATLDTADRHLCVCMRSGFVTPVSIHKLISVHTSDTTAHSLSMRMPSSVDLMAPMHSQ